MKQKREPGKMESYVSGITVGLIMMYLFWWLLTGMQHPGALAGGGVILIAMGILGRIVTKKERKAASR